MSELSYSDKVMDHFMHPRNTGEIPDANGVGTVGNPVCVTPETLIFTNSNIEEIKDISSNSRVLSHDGNYYRVKTIHSRSYKGKAYSITINNLGTSLVTPEHHILALRLGKRDKFRLYKESLADWCNAEELRKGDVILYPIPKETKDVNEINFGIEKLKWDFKSKALPQKIKIDNNFCRLVGYYLAEGYVRTDKCKGTIGFVFNSKEEVYIRDTLSLMEKIFNVKPTKLTQCDNGTATDIPFYSARLARFFESQFGKGALNKHLPHWMMELNLEKQRSILCGLWRGDGYIDLKRQRAKYVTISRQLAYQLRLLLMRQNIISNFSYGKSYGMHKESFLYYVQDDDSLRKIIKIMGLDLKIKPKIEQFNRHKSWFDSNFYYTTIRKIDSMRYRGLVYNLEVEGVHSYVSNALTLHNCGDVMKMFIKVENDIIVDAKFKTYGCGAAIATSSMVTEMVKGRTIEEALKISNRAVAEALGGLPAIKLHCSVLAEQALRSALADYYKKIGKDPSAFEPKSDTPPSNINIEMGKGDIRELTKKQIRSKIFLSLKTQKEEDRKRKTRIIKEKLFRLSVFKRAKKVMFYITFDGEVNTQEMIKETQKLGKIVAVPVCLGERIIKPCLLPKKAKLIRGLYGVSEPAIKRFVNLEDLDLVIVPGVAFDKKGNRLGRGKGCYDYFLKKLTSRKIPSIGLAFDFQILPSIPATSDDVSVNRVLFA